LQLRPAARHVGCSVSTLRRLISEGELVAYRVRGRLLVEKEQLEELILSSAAKA
jgi:excisionase family DNA binding protein